MSRKKLSIWELSPLQATNKNKPVLNEIEWKYADAMIQLVLIKYFDRLIIIVKSVKCHVAQHSRKPPQFLIVGRWSTCCDFQLRWKKWATIEWWWRRKKAGREREREKHFCKQIAFRPKSSTQNATGLQQNTVVRKGDSHVLLYKQISFIFDSRFSVVKVKVFHIYTCTCRGRGIAYESI